MESSLHNVNLFDEWLAFLYLFLFAFIGGSIDSVDHTTANSNLMSIKAWGGRLLSLGTQFSNFILIFQDVFQ